MFYAKTTTKNAKGNYEIWSFDSQKERENWLLVNPNAKKLTAKQAYKYL